ncbi:sporulation protein [Candidatus Bathyarchaeota archaeon]|jgi:uncharacterized spore protein YtfJ|nr:sporulation protein [Candidatus Bathyarchaeota archaeon]
MSESYMKTLADELSKAISANSVVGEPIVQEDKVLIPVIKMGFVMGTGSGKGSGETGTGEGTGGGGGGGIEPVALIAVYKDISGPDGVEVLPLKSPSRMPEVLEKAMETFGEMAKKKMEEKAEKKEEPETPTEEN